MKKTTLKCFALVSFLVLVGLTSCAPHKHVGGTATCTTLAVCEDCGESYGELLPHNHDQQKHDGENHWLECVCGDKANVTAHTWVEGEITLAPTCEEDGTQLYHCDCGASKTEVVAKTGHEFTTIKFDENNHWKECHCGEKAEVTAHTWVEGEITLAPRCVKAGKQQHTCTCGATKEIELPSLGGHIDENEDGICDECSESIENCNCNCHKSGIIGFIWKIFNFINKLFGKKEICACGISH
jgi:hypothetical protein